MAPHVGLQTKPLLVIAAGTKREVTAGSWEEPSGSTMKNYLSTKITVKQHASEFQQDFYADGDLLFLHLLSLCIRP